MSQFRLRPAQVAGALAVALAALALSACGESSKPAGGGDPGSGDPLIPAPPAPVDNSPPPPAASLDSSVLQDLLSFDRCDFLNRDYCMFPWPNNWFTTADSSTDTGLRINLNPLSMPSNVLAKPLDPSDWNRNDGFSPGQAILVRIPGLDLAKTGAVPLTDLAKSYAHDAPIEVIDADSGERQLIWAEMDANITKFEGCDTLGIVATLGSLLGEVGLPGVDSVETLANTLRGYCGQLPAISNPLVDPGPALIIRPAKNFTPGHRYIVALRNLKNTDSAAIEAPASFRIYRDNHSSSLPMVEGRRAHFEDLFTSLGKAGIPRAELFLAWDFTVASERNLTERVLHIRDDALAALGDDTPADGIVQGEAPTISNITVSDRVGDENIAREVRGVITVPSYLNIPNGPAGSRFYYAPSADSLYGDGLPDRNPIKGTQTFDFLCRIPRRAFDGAQDPATATKGVAQRPALYGHGLLGSQSEGSGQIGAIIQEVGMVYCATDWIGMASHNFDLTQPIDTVYYDPPLGDVLNVLTLLVDMSNFTTLTDRVQQSLVNFSYLGRAVMHPDGFCKLDAFKVGEQCLLDRSELYYDGNSQGGIIGGALLAVSPDIKAGVLGVPGMNYSTLLSRSVDFDLYATFFYASYQASLDQQFVLSLIQMLWDRAENDGYAWSLAAGKNLPGASPKRVLLHPAFGDHQVTMTSAEVMARTIGAGVHCPAVARGSSPQRGRAVYNLVNAAIGLDPLDLNRRHQDEEPYYAIPCLSNPHVGNALVVWDSGPTLRADGTPRNDADDSGEKLSGVAPPPVTNTPPRPELGYGADPHEYPRSTAASRQQKDAFFRSNGAVVDTCGGKPCATRKFEP
jgi:hypothetical protein